MDEDRLSLLAPLEKSARARPPPLAAKPMTEHEYQTHATRIADAVHSGLLSINERDALLRLAAQTEDAIACSDRAVGTRISLRAVPPGTLRAMASYVNERLLQ
jgi:hypothetical protein